MDTIEVPPFFLCPISLEMMKDPVTLSTGITYDRESIEKWLFSGRNDTCPVTKQILTGGIDLIPNVTLRRLIQAWCTLNASQGIERFPTPRPPISETQLAKLLREAESPQLQIKSLRKLKSISSRSETNRRSMEIAGAPGVLASIIVKNVGMSRDADEVFDELISPRAGDEALTLLYNLQLSESGLKSLIENDIAFVESLISVMQRGRYESRAYAVLMLKSIFEVAAEMQLVGLKPNFFFELVDILRDQICPKVLKAVLKLLITVCPYGRNRIKAVEAGAVPVLIDLLLDSTEKRGSEMMLMVLELLCQCAEGRSELLNHGAGLATVSKKILRVSPVASERGVRILHLISRFSATQSVLQEMLSMGVVTKLCFVLQVDCGSKMKEKAKEILKKNGWAWMNSPCIPRTLFPSHIC